MTTAKEPWEMTKAEREAEIARLKAENQAVLSTPLMSEGSISPMQVGLMGKREKEQWQKNASLRMQIEQHIKQLRLSDEELAKQKGAEVSKVQGGRILQLRRQIEDLKSIGVGKSGKMKPMYQRALDMAEAELATLTDASISSELAHTEVLKGYPELGKRKETPPSGKVRYHLLPDGVIWVKEKGGTGRTLASWRPGNRPDSTNEADEGSIWHDDKVYTSRADWDKAVRAKLDLDSSEFVAESWRGGGMIHKGDLIKRLTEDKVWRESLSKPVLIRKPKRKSKPRKHPSASARIKGLRR